VEGVLLITEQMDRVVLVAQVEEVVELELLVVLVVEAH
jgi:hypothetical protein